jgi:hypothetical protein
MDVLAQLLSLSNIVLCLAIVALVWAQRKGVEVLVSKTFKKDLKKSKVWTEFFVPIGPLGTGMLLMLVPQIPIPEMFTGGTLVKMVFGLGLGLLSGLVYRLAKKNILDKMGKSDEETPYVEE